MQCPECQSVNREGRRFCTRCGTPLPITCHHCSFLNEQESNYCGNCGTSLLHLNKNYSYEDKLSQSDTSHVIEKETTERRQITVMFCDLVGYTKLSTNLDPEDLRLIVREYQSTCVEVIDVYDGFVARYMGDGIMVYFGYPHAHEDDAERAVLTALDIIEAIKKLNIPLENDVVINPSVRIGISTGLVVVGDLIGTRAAEEEAVVGKTPNLAARLQSIADANSILISPETHRLLKQRFEYKDLGDKLIHGFNEPMKVWQVLNISNIQSRFEAYQKTRLSPLVGREDISRKLTELWHQTNNGTGHVMLISGEPGIGKSRIVETLREEIKDPDFTQLRYQCSPFHINSALYPFITQLERDADFKREDGTSEKLKKLESLLSITNEDLSEILPLFASLLSIPVKGHYRELDITPQQRKDLILKYLVTQINQYALLNPVLIIFEDAQWVDPSSLELLNVLIDKMHDERILLMITHRMEFSPPSVWNDYPHVTSQVLDPLTPSQSKKLIAGIVSNEMELPEEVFEHITWKTDGVPLFIEEVTLAIVESGQLKEAADGDTPFPAVEIPSTLQDSLMDRLDQLTPVKEIAQIGATLGREFSHEILASVCRLPKERLQNAIKQLTDSGLIKRHGSGIDTYYVFKHALIQDAAYESMLRSKRRELHKNIVHILQKYFPEKCEIEPELLAYHCIGADLTYRAIEYLAHAGHRALESCANYEAIGHVDKGLKLIHRLEDSHKRRLLELELQIAIGAAYRATNGFGTREVMDSFTRANILSEQVGDTMQYFDALRGLYTSYYVRGELNTAREKGIEVINKGRQNKDQRALSIGHYMLGAMMFWQGDFLDARKELQNALDYYDPTQHQKTTLAAQIDLQATVNNHLGWTLWILGYPDQAYEATQRALSTAHALSQNFTKAMVHFWAGEVRWCLGRFDDTWELLNDLKTLSIEHSLAYMGAIADVLEGQFLIEKDQIEPGLKKVETAFSKFEGQEAGLGRPWALSVAITGLLKMRNFEKGLIMLDNAFSAMEQNNERQWEAELHRLHGELLFHQTNPDIPAAEKSYLKAIEAAQSQHAKSLELRAVMSFGKLLESQGHKVKARQLLDDTYSWFEEGSDTRDLKTAKRLLAEWN